MYASLIEAARFFDEQYLSQVIISIILINCWNRVAITTHMQPALATPEPVTS